ncbi:MAG: amidohydrolase family protein [Leifsonia sp.]
MWDRSRAEYAWLGPHLPEVDRDVTFDEVVPSLDRAGVGGVVLVQSADQLGDTQYLLEVARAESRVLGVVGWLPLEDPATVAAQLEGVLGDPRIVGIRNLIHDRDDPDWVLRQPFDASLGLLEDAGLPFDFVSSGPDALTRLIAVADRHPNLPIVLDHLGKPAIDGDGAALGDWERLLRAAATRPNVHAKISGLYATVGPMAAWTPAQVSYAAEIALDAFGGTRVMYGGDWPMSIMAGGHDRVFDALTAATSGWSVDDREGYFWRNAGVFYRLAATAP